MSPSAQKLLQIEDLVLHFKTSNGTVQAVDGVDFELDSNRAVVILGESGCGKSSLAKAILRLLPRNVEHYGGKVFLNGGDVMKLGDDEFRQQVRWVRQHEADRGTPRRQAGFGKGRIVHRADGSAAAATQRRYSHWP